jgi:hypothetical protein
MDSALGALAVTADYYRLFIREFGMQLYGGGEIDGS